MIELFLFLAMAFGGTTTGQVRTAPARPHFRAIGPKVCQTAACLEDGF